MGDVPKSEPTREKPRLPTEAYEIMAHLLVDTYVVDDVVRKGMAACDRIEAMFLQRRGGRGVPRRRRRSRG